METSPVGTFRADVQGLRAIAVIAVILFHFEANRFPFGYLGVDVFAVISGYVVSSVVMREIRATGQFSIKQFVARRSRRLLPVLFVVLSVTTVSWLIVTPVTLHREVVIAAVSAVVISANVFFYQQSTDYFAEDRSPFIHLWSLSMEEQFYLLLALFVPLIGALNRSVRLRFTDFTAGRFLVALSFGSLGFIYVAQHAIFSANPSPIESWLFYFPFGRMWQFLAGIAVASLTIDRSDFISDSKRAIRLTALLFVPLILILLLEQTPSNSFVTWQRIGVTYLSAAVLLVNSVVSNRGILAHPILTAIGDRSYSIYLWHVPVMAVWREAVGSVPSLVTVTVVVFGLTEITYRLVEAPFRSRQKPRTRHWLMPVFGLLSIVVAPALVASGAIGLVIQQVGSGEPSIVAGDQWAEFAGRVQRDECQVTDDFYICGAATGDVDVVLMGDSHAQSIAHAFLDAAYRADLRPFVAVRPGCRVLGSRTWLSSHGGEGSPCEVVSRRLIEQVAVSKPMLFLAECPTRPGFGCPDPELLDLSMEFISVREMNVMKLAELFGSVVMVQELPIVGDAYSSQQSLLAALRRSPPRTRVAIRADLQGYISYFRSDLERLTVDTSDRISLLDPWPILCSQDSCLSTDATGRSVWANEDHLTVHGAQYLIPQLELLMRRVIKQ